MNIIKSSKKIWKNIYIQNKVQNFGNKQQILQRDNIDLERFYFKGQHCETTAIGCLLKHIGINLSEPMLFGIGQGLGYGFFNMKIMDYPFIGGRIKPDQIVKNICKQMDLELEIKQTSSIKKAQKNIDDYLKEGQVVGLKLDCYHLDYFQTKIHFAAHYATLFNIENDIAYLVDTQQQNQKGGICQTSLKSLQIARNEKGPMSSKNLSFVIKNPKQLKFEKQNLTQIIMDSIFKNTQEYLNPPIKNFGYKGIKKTSEVLIPLFKKSSQDKKQAFSTMGILIERGGTGGGLFRYIYSQFLKECYDQTGNKQFLELAQNFQQIGKKWTIVSDLLQSAGNEQKIEYLEEASQILEQLAIQEEEAMKILNQISSQSL